MPPQVDIDLPGVGSIAWSVRQWQGLTEKRLVKLMISKTTARFVLAALLCGVLAPASSDADVLAERIFSIEAQALGGGNSVIFHVPLSNAVIEGNTLVWELVEEVALADIAVLHEARIEYVTIEIPAAGSRGDTAAQSVTVNFLVSSGEAGANFTMTAAPVTLTIPNAVARATAGITVTDNGGNGPGLLGNFADDSAYRTHYNDLDSAATGSTFATLVPGISGGPGATVVSSENFPDQLVTYSSVDENNVPLGSVNNISSQWNFAVSPNNSAAGTSRFEVIPEPVSCLLWIFGAALLLLTRRR